MNYHFSFPSVVGLNAEEVSALAKEKGLDIPPQCAEMFAAIIQKNNERAGSVIQQHMSANLTGLTERINELEKKLK